MITLARIIEALEPRALTRIPAAVLAREVTAVTADSRRVVPGSLFVAVRGEKADGRAFIPEAVRRGCLAVAVRWDGNYVDRYGWGAAATKRQAYLRALDECLTPERAARVRFRRAVALMTMTLVLPGSAQVACGNKRVGRAALRRWFALRPIAGRCCRPRPQSWRDTSRSES